MQYADYAVWQRQWLSGGALESQLGYWRHRLGDATAPLDLPWDRPRPAVPSGRGSWRRFQLDPALTTALGALARQRELTLFMVILAAFQALLQRYSGQSSFNVGTPVANRTRSEIEPLIGFFVNTLVLRGELSAGQSFADLLGQARKVTVEAQAHQDLPFEKLVEELRPQRDRSRTPLFQVLLVLQNAPLEPLALPGVTLSPVPVDTGTAKFDLILAVAEQGGALDAAFEYATELLDAATVDRMAGHLRTLLAAAVAAPEGIVAEMPLLTEAEIRQLAEPQGEPPAWPQSLCLHEQFELQVRQRPGAVAVSFDGRAWTYGELDREANRLAHHLRHLGIGPETRVGLCMDRSLELVAGILGILKAGGAYVPLDPVHPSERLAYLLSDARAPVVVTRQIHLAALGLAGSAARIRAVCLDRDAAAIALEPEEPPRAGSGPASAAYVIYTSGSTGAPKGVVVTHANVGRLFAATQGWFGFGAGDVWTMFHSFAFDFSVWELWGSLLYGGRLAVVSREVAQSSEAYADLLRREQVTVVNQTPSAFRRLVPELERGQGEVRLVVLGGEAVDLPSLRHWFELFPGEEPRLVNMYGITETTVHVTYRPLRPSDLAVPWQGSPVGIPIGDLRVHLMDGAGQPAPEGVPGEICVAGEGLARGYLDRPDLTAARFIPDRFGRRGGERLYRSGDLARRLRGGELEYLGRIDHQVKVRGFRIEPGEIESALRRHPSLEEAVVVALPDHEGDRRLVAYVSPATGAEVPDRAELRELLRDLLPEYMVPAVFVALPALPLTPNGKVDRRALPEPGIDRPEVENRFAVPWSPAKEVLAGIWCEVLGLETVSSDSDFFELGGHSLLGTQIVSRVRELFGVEMPLRDLFASPTLAGLARRIEESQGKMATEGERVRAVPRTGELPLSCAQQRLWFLDHLEPDSAAYNIPLALRLGGELRLDLLRRALSEVVRRHEVLRTTFASRDGRSRQVIAPPGEVPLPVIDLSALSGPERQREADRLVAEEAGRPFSLVYGPLLRIRLARFAATDSVLLVTLHHIVSDGWSLPIFVRETAALYEAFAAGLPSPLSDLPFQYADYAAWQRQWLRGPALAETLAFWSARLRGLPAVLELPTDRPRPAVRTWRGGRVGGWLDEDLSQRALRLGRREGATPFMILLAAFGALLHRQGGQESFAVGTPVAGRNRFELEPLIGFFVNTLVLRCDPSGGSTFREVLARVRETVLEADVHQELPFEKLVEELAPERVLSHTPLFQVMLAFLNVPWREVAVEGLTVEPMGEGNAAAKFDLTLAARLDGARFRLDLEYATELFDEVTATRLLGHLERLLAGAVEDVALRVSELPLLDGAERHQLLVWNGVAAPERLGRPVHELFAAQARRTPDAVAVEHLGRSMSYRDLWCRAAAIARRLRSRGAGPDVPVALCLERSPELVAGVLGILAAGGAFLPLDPTLPAERLAYLLDDSRAPMVVTRRALLSALPVRVAAQAILLDDIADGEGQPGPEPAETVAPDSLAYVIYTSGSTGGPKGVMISHRGLLHYLGWSLRAYVEPERRGAALATSLSFDLAITSLFTPLLAGQTVVLLPEGEGPEALIEGLRDQSGLSFLKLTPAHLEVLNRGLLDLPIEDKAAVLVLGGEALSGESLAPWRERAPAIRMVNEYGPTEAVVGCCVYELPPGPVAAGPVPIGRPLPGTRLHTLDRWGSLVPAGVPGELYAGGEGLARGYLGRPALTAERFVPDPFSAEPGARLYRTGDLARLRRDGNLEFLGRIDQQVKVRGYRIEPGEIAVALLEHTDVREAVVLAREDDPGDRRLVAYVVTAPERTVAIGELRDLLERRLPAYMVPASFISLPALPLTANGKVDLRALPAPGTARPDLEEVFVAPSSPAERQLAAIWSQVLRIERVGVHDNFFQLGGDSILSLQIVSRANRAGLQISTRQIFERQTVAGLAAVASFAPALETDQGPVLGTLPLTPIQRWFFEQEMPDPEHYNQALLLVSDREIAPQVLRRAVARLLEHHDALRLRFEPGDGGWRQTLAAPGGEPPVCCVDLSDLSADRRSAELAAAASALQASLNLGTGPILRVALFRSGAGSPDRLLLVIHHLAVDGVSWRILLEDFQDLCRRLPEQGPCELPAKTTSYKRWSERLREHVASGAVDPERSYWTGEARRTVTPLPRDASGANTVAEVDLVSVELSFEETEALLHEVPQAYRTQINDLLLTALARAFHGWTGERSLLIDLEGHGREEILDGTDLSRTVGWFTSIFPLLIHLDEDLEDPGTVLTAVKEQLRGVPDRGIGYGLLRYLATAEEGLGALPQAEVSFNYLGQLDTALAAGGLRPAAEPVGRLRSPRQPRRHAIEIVGRILDGHLRVELLYSRGLHERATIEGLAGRFLDSLRSLIEHCRSPWASGVTPSDFPLVDLSQEQLALAIRQVGQAKV